MLDLEQASGTRAVEKMDAVGPNNPLANGPAPTHRVRSELWIALAVYQMFRDLFAQTGEEWIVPGIRIAEDNILDQFDIDPVGSRNALIIWEVFHAISRDHRTPNEQRQSEEG